MCKSPSESEAQILPKKVWSKHNIIHWKALWMDLTFLWKIWLFFQNVPQFMKQVLEMLIYVKEY
jgi:hypothetical protein